MLFENYFLVISVIEIELSIELAKIIILSDYAFLYIKEFKKT